MQPLVIEKTTSTPGVILDKSNDVFVFCGRSIPEDPAGFFRPVIDWIEQYIQNPNLATTLIFELEYFNSASAKVFATIFDLVEIVFNKGFEVNVEWHFESFDSDTLEAGLDFASLVEFPFKYKELSLHM